MELVCINMKRTISRFHTTDRLLIELVHTYTNHLRGGFKLQMDSESVSSSDEEQVTCPLCYEPMDDTDLTLFPCPCNFQVCHLR